jgi:hypothetical protein
MHYGSAKRPMSIETHPDELCGIRPLSNTTSTDRDEESLQNSKRAS